MSLSPNWTEKLKKWRQQKAEDYARTVLSPPERKAPYRALPFPGCYLIMGRRRGGKSGLAHELAGIYHERLGVPAVLHLPTVPLATRKKMQKLLPKWMKVVTRRSEWPKKAIIIYDEAAQTAHARRSQTGDAVELDNLVSISGQREQMVLFIAHHSRKVDCNLVTEIDGVLWKDPTYAHQMFERDVMADFVMRAFDYFGNIKGAIAKKKATLYLDMHKFQFFQFNNGLPEWWTETLSQIFEDIQNIKTGEETN